MSSIGWVLGHSNQKTGFILFFSHPFSSPTLLFLPINLLTTYYQHTYPYY
jgi:hypothetical protein